MKPAANHPDTMPLYGAEQMRTLDRHAIEDAGIPGYTLMTRAATAAWSALQARWPAARELLVLCGGCLGTTQLWESRKSCLVWNTLVQSM